MAKSTALLMTLSLMATGLVWACVSELPGPPVCSHQAQCGTGKTCVLGRCRKAKKLPVSKKAEIIRFEPETYVLLRSSGDLRPSDQPQEAIVLGGPEQPTTLALFRFAVKLPEEAKIQSALLVLDPLPRCSRRPGKTTLELAQVLGRWDPGSVSFNRRPELSIPMTTATVNTTPPTPLRLDVSELVEQWREHRSRYHGLALLASHQSGQGACYSTGLSWGQGPRLEIYLAPEAKKKPEDAGADAQPASDGAVDGAADGAADASVDDAGDDDW